MGRMCLFLNLAYGVSWPTAPSLRVRIKRSESRAADLILTTREEEQVRKSAFSESSNTSHKRKILTLHCATPTETTRVSAASVSIKDTIKSSGTRLIFMFIVVLIINNVSAIYNVISHLVLGYQ